MKIEAKDLSKHFGDKLIFKNFSYTFLSGNSYGISGLNGSGKSTLLKVIAGYSTPTSGAIIYSKDGMSIERSRIFEHLSFIGPYIDIPMSYTFKELLDYHFSFRNSLKNTTKLEIEKIFNFPKDKLIQNFSSGMLQRVKLALAFFTDSAIVFLDEPTETLDEAGYMLYKTLLDEYSENRLILISSNKERDFHKTKEVISIEKFK